MFTTDQVRSLGGRTDLFILQAQGARIEPRDGYLRILSPQNPGFFWGNFLYFRSPPQSGDFSRWESLFRHEFRLHPDVRHRTFGWDGENSGELADFTAAGFFYDPATVLRLREAELTQPARSFSGLEVRPLFGDTDWEAAVQQQLASRLEGFELATYEPFKRRQMAAYRAAAEQGAGTWWGGFSDRRLVADCGLFFFRDCARFQSVGTHPAWRRRGLCATLIHEVSRRAFALDRQITLVMAAASGEPAERIYRSVGYLPLEQQHGLCRRPLP